MNRFLSLFVLVLFLISPKTLAQDTLISAAETLAFGLFTSTEVAKYSRGATSNAPPVDAVTKYRFREFTSQIEMVIGQEFGIEYQVNRKPRGRPIEITTVIHFPEPGLVHPRGHTYLKSEETKMVKIGYPHLHGYGFDEEWELVPGKWVFEVWHKKAKLVSKTFTVTGASS